MVQINLPFPYRLRPMRLDDVAAVMKIEQVVKPSPWSAESYEAEITRNPQSSPVVLEVGGEIVGYIVTWLVLDEMSVLALATAEAWRGRGLGELLLLDALIRAIDEGATQATLEVRRSNEVAQSLYRKYGFEVVGERKGYYRDNREDALIMTAAPIDLAYETRLNAQWDVLESRLKGEVSKR